MGRIAHCPEDRRRSIWYARPAPHLARYLTAYDAYDVRLPPDETVEDLVPPAWAAIRFTLTPEPWSARIGARLFNPLPPDALWGPTSHAAYTRFGRGHVVCAGLTPLGWARFVGRDASCHADRVSPLGVVWPATAGALRAAVKEAEDPTATFDAFFTDLLDRTAPEDEAIAALLPLLLDPAVLTVAQVADRLAMTPRALGALSTRHFGFTPKLLLRRARFMRALINLLRTERGGWAPLVAEAGYHDQSHFVRDCQLFLGMSMSAFARRPKPLFEASIRLRAAVLGAPAQALHPLAPAVLDARA